MEVPTKLRIEQIISFNNGSPAGQREIVSEFGSPAVKSIDYRYSSLGAVWTVDLQSRFGVFNFLLERLAFNENAFGYNAISDSFPEPSKSSTQFTDKKYKQAVTTMRQLESDNVNTKKKVLKALKLNDKKAQQDQLQGIHIVNGNERTLL
jgi:hypothetical protein